MESFPIISIDRKKCAVCYACVRGCPVKAIQIRKDQVFPEIDSQKCIGCGSCINSCAFCAISYHDSCNEVKALLRSGVKVAAICDPAIAGEFDDITDYRKFVEMIRLLGFEYVNEVSFGVDLIAGKFKALVDDFKGKYYITANCPAIVTYIEKFYPELCANLSPFVSPAAATALTVRKQFGEDTKIVYISPCVAAKQDVNRFTEWTKIDAVLTFIELRELFREFKIKESNLEYSDFDKPYGYKGSLYSIPNGFFEAGNIDFGLLTGNNVTVQGKTDSLACVKQFSESIDFIKCNFNLFFCEGCLSGPGMSKKSGKYIKHTFITDYAKKRLAGFNKKSWEEAQELYSKDSNLATSYHNHSIFLPPPCEEEIQEALKLIHPDRAEQPNCSACGYENCRELAVAVAQGIAVPDICYMNSQQGIRSHNQLLKKVNKQLNEATTEISDLKKTIEMERAELNVKNNSFSVLIQNVNAGIVIADKDLKIVESNRSFIEILGDDAKEIDEVIPFLVGANLNTLIPKPLVTQFNYIFTGNENVLNKDIEFSDKLINVTLFSLIPGKLAGAIFRNLHSAEERPEEIIHRVTEVIEENLRQVQQIGFILGEGASKTEKMLNSIIKSYK